MSPKNCILTSTTKEGKWYFEEEINGLPLFTHSKERAIRMTKEECERMWLKHGSAMDTYLIEKVS